MKPLKLTMRAFGSYGKETAIDFTKISQKLFLVTGDTGAGKSTVFDAIVFALYGEASSTSNKKDGTLLQSQYAAFDVTPFVRLQFSDGDGGDIYTVTRIPRHERLMTRGKDKGRGTRKENASVSLTMPDGSEYPSKETDRKIEEIVGLTKEQFMQIAMIAQGEFMELLRAKSDAKKVIFRKLFHTDFYERIVSELEERRRQKEREIAGMKTRYAAIVRRVDIPEDYEQAEELSLLIRQVEDGIWGNMEEFLRALGLLCERCKGVREEAERQYRAASDVRDQKRDACTAAENLLKFYAQLEQAEADLKECESERQKMEDKRRLRTGLQAAFEVLTEYRAWETAKKAAESAKREKQRQEEALPGFEKSAQELKSREKDEEKKYDIAREKYNKLTARVEEARKVFAEIAQKEKECAESDRALKDAEKKRQAAKRHFAELEEGVKKWKAQAEALADAETVLEKWKFWEKQAKGLAEASGEVRELEAQIEIQSQRAKRAATAYEKARTAYRKENALYEQERQGFLDAQAGIFAARLREGEPCPICGARQHPAPYQGGEIKESLSGKEIEILGVEVEKLRKKQEEASGKAGMEEGALQEKKVQYDGELRKLAQEYREAKAGAGAPEAGEEGMPDGAKEVSIHILVENFVKRVQSEGAALLKNAERLKNIQKKLEDAEKEKEKLRLSVEELTEIVNGADLAVHQRRAQLESLSGRTEFAGIEEAEKLLCEEAEKQDAVKALCEAAQEKAKRAEDKVKEAKTLLQKYAAELPQKEAEAKEKKALYLSLMESRDISEAEWKRLTTEHTKEDIDILQQEIEDYRRREQTARKLKEMAQKAVDGKEKPVLEKLEAERAKADERLSGAKEKLEVCAIRERDNAAVFGELAPGAQNRRGMIEQYSRLERLYKLVSGNVSGSRMDLETFVQRYYLEKILTAANRRFLQMTAGQFELRMVSAERAGKGRNRGLDLMVYSTVTEKEREVRTLSGGESFMAALSLALGMADQIQENTASIHLDIMFIDEGFGSLDEHSRDQAVRVLKEMAEGEKMIGIISHVAELKQEIEDKLVVSKSDRGSTVRWEG